MPGPTPQADAAFEVPARFTTFSDQQTLAAFDTEPEPVYRLGTGDRIFVDVAARTELSGEHLIGPDGRITLPFAGSLEVAGLTREAAAELIEKALAPYYLDLDATVRVDEYSSNRVVVLGRVENPGILRFETPPTLLDMLAQAGGLPLLRKEQLLTRCAIIRGDKILWVDLERLLAGDLALNVSLRRNDVVYIPDASETPVYVMGAVRTPGVYRLTPQMSFLDALGQAGGPTLDANLNRLHVIRPAKGVNLAFALDQLLEPDPSVNVAMEQGDILYVPYHGVAKIGYILDRLNPFSTLFAIQQISTGSE